MYLVLLVRDAIARCNRSKWQRHACVNEQLSVFSLITKVRECEARYLAHDEVHESVEAAVGDACHKIIVLQHVRLRKPFSEEEQVLLIFHFDFVPVFFLDDPDDTIIAPLQYVTQAVVNGLDCPSSKPALAAKANVDEVSAGGILTPLIPLLEVHICLRIWLDAITIIYCTATRRVRHLAISQAL